jgi:hypothetical protein
MTESAGAGYALQIKSNAATSRAFWDFDDEFGAIRATLDEAVSDLNAAHGYGYIKEHLRIVALSVVTADEAVTRCPIHGIPDCSPLLNGCSMPGAGG